MLHTEPVAANSPDNEEEKQETEVNRAAVLEMNQQQLQATSEKLDGMKQAMHEKEQETEHLNGKIQMLYEHFINTVDSEQKGQIDEIFSQIVENK